MNTSLIILNYNDHERTASLAVSAATHQSLKHIVIVDNCSTDGSFEKLASLQSEKIHLIKSPSNGGYAKGNNFGCLYALKNFKSEVLFIANPDVAFDDNTACAMASILISHPEYGVCAPLVRQGFNVWRLSSFIGIIESLFLIWFNLDKKLLRKMIESGREQVVPVGVVEGSFFALSANAYKKAKGFDERTFLYAEEVILARRLKAAGFSECVLKDFRYDHLHSASIKKAYQSSKAKAFHNFVDSFRIYNKYYLHTNTVQNAVFDFACLLAYAERVVYDLIMNLKNAVRRR